uniref:putative O-glycosylation ligase, exosortase A system-associated n=1 Tax=Pseudomaricurvus sp. TaxID=2004510 RepID=UPI003F6D41BF
MRDLLVAALVFGSLPFILKRPYIGILVWSWLSYMNPHRLTWGFAYNMPFAQIVALTLIMAIFMDKSKKSIPVDKTTITWGIFFVWLTLSTIFAMYPGSAWPMYDRIFKIQLVTVLTIMLMTDQKKIDWLIYVIVLSLGFYSIKGGVFTILTGGAYRVWGPPGSFVEENNSLALATLMVVPLMVYVYQTTIYKWLKPLMLLAILLSLASALGSQSRGALVAILALAGYFWISSSYKVLTGPLLIVMAIVAFSFMPESWHTRMETIQNYQEDASAMGRINAWQYSINVANDRLFGAGLQSWKLESFMMYAPDPLAVHAAHSIFFGVLGDS